MTFIDRFSADPIGAFSACFVWIPLAVWIISLIGWMVTGDMEILYGVAGIGAGIGLGLATAFPPDKSLSPLILIAVIVTTVLFPFARAAMNRRALVAIDIEQMEKFGEALRLKPDNVGAMIKLAELLYKRGFPAQAIALAEKALVAMPPSLFRPEHNMVSAWKMVVTDPALFRPVPCLHCGEPTPPGELNCPHCGYPTVLEMAKGKWVPHGTGMQLIAVWIGALIVFVGLPATAKLSQTSLALGLALMVLQVAFGVWILLKTFLRSGQNEAA